MLISVKYSGLDFLGKVYTNLCFEKHQSLIQLFNYCFRVASREILVVVIIFSSKRYKKYIPVSIMPDRTFCYFLAVHNYFFVIIIGDHINYWFLHFSYNFSMMSFNLNPLLHTIDSMSNEV